MFVLSSLHAHSLIQTLMDVEDRIVIIRIQTRLIIGVKMSHIKYKVIVLN